ncbi:MAG: DUF3352 domain-containing protein [Desulforegulaceae bacterium]|nr:DUF3352 domain-containing protein [Desulforegulaceae bacterium]
MKKIFISFFILALASGVGAYFYLIKAPVLLPSAPEQLLPENTTFLIQIKNLEKNIKSISKNNLGQNIKKIDFISTAKKLELPEETIKGFEKFKSDFSSKINQEIFYNFLGKNISFALISFDLEKPLENMEAALLIQSKINSKFSQILSESISEIETKEKFEYKKTTISKARYKDSFDFYHFLINEYLILTLNLETAQKIAGVTKEKSLASTKKYKNIKNKINFKKRDFFFYADTKEIYSKIERISKKNKTDFLVNLKSRLNNDLKSVVLCGFNRGDSFYESISEVELNYKNTIKKENGKNFLSMVPKDLVSFSWQNKFNPEKFIDNIFNDKEKLKEFEQKLLFETQVDPRTFYNEFKGELGIIITDTDTRGIFPVPSLAFVFDKKAGPVFNKGFDSIRKKQNNLIPLQNKTLNNVKIKSIPLPFGKSIEPSWGYFNDYFIVSVNTFVFQKIIDSGKSGNSIENNSNFKFIKEQFPEEFNMISFFDTIKFLDNLKDSGRSILKLSKFKSPDLTEKGEILLDEVLVPLFDGLSIYKAFGNASVFEDDKLHGKGIIKKSGE